MYLYIPDINGILRFILRRTLSKCAILVEQHLICPIDVVHLIRVHRDKNTTYICLKLIRDEETNEKTLLSSTNSKLLL